MLKTKICCEEIAKRIRLTVQRAFSTRKPVQYPDQICIGNITTMEQLIDRLQQSFQAMSDDHNLYRGIVEGIAATVGIR